VRNTQADDPGEEKIPGGMRGIRSEPKAVASCRRRQVAVPGRRGAAQRGRTCLILAGTQQPKKPGSRNPIGRPRIQTAGTRRRQAAVPGRQAGTAGIWEAAPLPEPAAGEVKAGTQLQTQWRRRRREQQAGSRLNGGRQAETNRQVRQV